MSCPGTIAARSLTLATVSLAAACGASPPASKDLPAPRAAQSPAPGPSGPVASGAPQEPPSAPGPVVITRGLGDVDDLVASDDFLYLVKKKSVVTRIPIAGGPPEDIATFAEQAVIESIAPSAEGLYVLITAIGAEATKQGYAGQGSLFLIPAKGGDAQSLAQGFRRPATLVVDEAQVHWTAVKDAGKKASWFLFSAPRKTAATVTLTATATALVDRAAGARGAVLAGEERDARLVGESRGEAVLSWSDGAIVVRPFGSAPARGTRKTTAPPAAAAYAIAHPCAAISGDRLVLGGRASRDGKATSVVGLASLAAPAEELVPLAVLDGSATVGAVAFAGDEVVYTLTGTKEKHDKDGSVVRVSTADRKSTVLATDQFQPTRIVVTSRGLIWLDKGATDSDEPDGALVLLPR